MCVVPWVLIGLNVFAGRFLVVVVLGSPFLRKRRVRRALAKSTSGYVTRVGLAYFRDILMYELNNNPYIDYYDAQRHRRFLVNTGVDGMTHRIVSTAIDFPVLFGELCGVYPSIMSTLESLAREARVNITMFSRTQRFHPDPAQRRVRLSYYVENVVGREYRDLNTLLETYPREMSAIFYAFSGTAGLEAAAHDVLVEGSMVGFIRYIIEASETQLDDLFEQMNKFKRVAQTAAL